MNIKFIPFLLTSLILVLLPTKNASANFRNAKVLDVVDGDTLHVEIDGKETLADLACIDSPELTQSKYGVQSANALKSLVPVGSYIYALEDNQKSANGYIALVFNENGFVNETMVRQGHALVANELNGICIGHHDALNAAQITARDNRLSYWNQSNPVAPWRLSDSQNPELQSHPSIEVLKAKIVHGKAEEDWEQVLKLMNELILRSPSDALEVAIERDRIQATRYSSSKSSQKIDTSEFGGCTYPWQRDASGKMCGDRSALRRPGGANGTSYRIYPSTYSSGRPSYRRTRTYRRSSGSSSFSRGSGGSGRTYVRPYTRKDGTRVRGHYRRR